MEHAKLQAVEALDEFKLRDELRKLRTQIPDQPSLNPIVNVAFDLSRRLEAGHIALDDLKALAGRLMDRACVVRARRLRERIGYVDAATTAKDFTEFVEASVPKDLSPDAAFKAFEERWSRARAGIVFTAHPTFGVSDALSRRMVEIAVSNEQNPNPIIGVRHRPSNGITLNYEHQRVQEAITHIRDAYVDLLNSFYSVAATRCGDKAYKLRPHLATIAHWVGYDLDGRMDITWLHSFQFKLQEKRAVLLDIRERFLVIKHRLGDSDATMRLFRQITGKFDLAINAVEEQINALSEVGVGKGNLAKAANVITSGEGSYNLVSTDSIIVLLEQLIDSLDAPQMKRAVAALIGLIQATGLGTAHIHVRINAVQLNNAFRAFVHEPWTRDLSEAQALARIVEMIRTAKPESVNFGSLDAETATAIRQFGLIAQIQKHVDRETPIRFLIAECESPATVLIAVFFAKLFGVSEVTDISPLFETPAGLESGPRMIERLLQEEAYRDYVRGRGRLSMQTGFSDAGRFIGQIAATLAIERLHHHMADLIHRAGLTGVETLIFSTHGESMGRGAHPGDLKKRLRYVFSGESRRRFVRYGLPVKHETSFQGGDGYMFFANKPLSTRGLATIVMDGAEPPLDVVDPFYADETLGLDFLLRLREYQQHLFAHPGYRAVLGAFGPNLLFKTGSRAVKRQMENATAADRGDPARMRAIPNNAILQQFGYIANVVAGLGAAVGSERDRFIALAKVSNRLRSLIEMIARGKQLSSLNAMGANAMLFDPGFWAARASWGREPHLDAAFKTLGANLLEDDRAGAITGLAHHLRLDAIELHQILEEIGLEGGKIPDDHRLELDLLQAIRLAMIMRVFILSAQLPRFTTRDVSHAQIFGWALALEIPEVINVMRAAFPTRSGDDLAAGGFDEVATYQPHGREDYGRIETEILKPMDDAYEFIREIGTGISHHFGAFG